LHAFLRFLCYLGVFRKRIFHDTSDWCKVSNVSIVRIVPLGLGRRSRARSGCCRLWRFGGRIAVRHGLHRKGERGDMRAAAMRLVARKRRRQSRKECLRPTLGPIQPCASASFNGRTPRHAGPARSRTHTTNHGLGREDKRENKTTYHWLWAAICPALLLRTHRPSRLNVGLGDRSWVRSPRVTVHLVQHP